ncbi:MAG: zinc-ribbon domain-containing protein [Candidatus Binatia bacterium]
MLVKCPSCTTTYKVSDDLMQGATPAFRCSRCKHTFELELGVPSKPVTPPPSDINSTPAGDDEGKELTFTFGPRELESESAGALGKGETAQLDAAFQPPEAAVSTEEQCPQGSMPTVKSKPKKPFTMVDSSASVINKEKVLDDPHVNIVPEEKTFEGLPPPPNKNISVLAPYRDQQASTLPYLTLFALLTLFFSLATAFQYAYPEILDSFIKKIPLIGTAVVKNTHLKNGVALQSLRGSYQVIQGNRQVFLVTGVAMNQNPVVIREVSVGGETYSPDEKSIELQDMWIGNAISPKIIRGMTTRDISDLQRLKPLKTFEIPPGDSVPFTIVFLKPAKGIKDFTCKVLSAEEV